MTESIDAPLACFTIRFQPRTSGGFPIEATASDGRRLARDFLPPTTLDQSGVTARAVPGPRGWRDLSGGPSVLPEDLGAGLFAALISGEMEALYREDLGRNDGALALVLVFDPDDLDHLELYAWPWERLQDGERILVLSGRPVVLRLTVDQPTPPAPLRVDRLRILAIPVDDTDLDLDAEVESLRTIRDNGGPFDLVVREQSPNRVELRRMLADGGFHVLHIMGHGRWSTSDRSWVLDLAGEAISAAELGDLVAQELHDTRLVVLNTCHSARGLGVGGEVDAGLAISLVRHGALAVVANRAPISDAAAGLLTDGLYRQLAAGMAVAEALGDARRDLRAGETRRLGVHRDEWSTPVLLLRSSTTVLDDRLFVLDPATRRPPTLGVAALGLGAFGVGGLAATGAAWLAHPPELLAAVPAAVLGAKVAWRWLRGEATTSSLLTAWATRLAERAAPALTAALVLAMVGLVAWLGLAVPRVESLPCLRQVPPGTDLTRRGLLYAFGAPGDATWNRQWVADLVRDWQARFEPVAAGSEVAKRLRPECFAWRVEAEAEPMGDAMITRLRVVGRDGVVLDLEEPKSPDAMLGELRHRLLAAFGGTDADRDELSETSRRANQEAMVLYLAGDRAAASAVLARAVERDGDAVVLRNNLGRILVERAVVARSVDPEGRSVEARGLLLDALWHLDRAVALDPAEPTVRYHRAEAYRQLDDVERAEADLEVALDRAPAFAAAANDLAALLLDRDAPDPTRAIELLERARVVVDPADDATRATILKNLGRAYHQAGEQSAAWAAFDAAECTAPPDRPGLRAEILGRSAALHVALLGPASAAVTWRRYGRVAFDDIDPSRRAAFLRVAQNDRSVLGALSPVAKRLWSARCADQEMPT